MSRIGTSVIKMHAHEMFPAGISIESLKGSETAVFASTMAFDYIKMLSRDPDDLPPSALSGTAASILANRLSWYYDLKGPSVHVDTACSSGLIAVDLACQSILTGSANMVGLLPLSPFFSWITVSDHKTGPCVMQQYAVDPGDLDLAIKPGFPFP